MEHPFPYRDSVKGTGSEYSFIEDSARHVTGGSGKEAFLLMDSISGT